MLVEEVGMEAYVFIAWKGDLWKDESITKMRFVVGRKKICVVGSSHNDQLWKCIREDDNCTKVVWIYYATEEVWLYVNFL